MFKKHFTAVLIGMCILAMASVSCYASDGYFNWWLVAADGSEARQITRYTNSYHGPGGDLSPDGTMLVITSASGLEIIDLNGQLIKSIAVNGRVMSLSWHPNGIISYSVWPYNRDCRQRFAVAWPDGVPKLLHEADGGSISELSPDGQWLLISRAAGDERRVSLVEILTGQETILPHRFTSSIVWASDSSMVAIETDGVTSVYNTKGQLIYRVTCGSAPQDWSSDDSRLLVNSFETGFHTIDASTGTTVNFLPVEQYAWSGEFAPDGRSICYIRNDGPARGEFSCSLWVSNLTSTTKILDTGGEFLSKATWLPDGRSLVVAWESSSASPQPILPRRVSDVRESNPNVDTPDFRNARWGMTVNGVRASETDCRLVDDGDGGTGLVGFTSLAGYSVIVGYEFDRAGRLERGIYVLDELHTEGNSYIDDFDDLKGLLTAKYGKPISDYPNWKNELFKNQRTSWGVALQLGHVTFGAMWETPTTTITMILTGDNFEVTHGIIYGSKSPANAPAARDTTGL